MWPMQSDNVRRYYEAQAHCFGEPHRYIGDGRDLSKVPRPDEYVAAPPSVLEACGFYFLNVLQRDNGSVYVFQADAEGTPTFGVLATSDGRDAYLEVYGEGGESMGAAHIDRSVPSLEWLDVQTVRYRAGIQGFE
jgi:hypothetical protein